MSPGTRSRNLSKRYDEATRRAVSLVKRDHPDLVGVMIQGSIARGEPGPYSDIDILGVTRTGKKPAEYSYYDGDIYVPIAFRSVRELEREFTDPRQFFWAKGSAKTSTRIIYDPRRVLRRIMLRGKKTVPSRLILEKALSEDYRGIIEYSGKLRNGWSRGDEYLTRYAARVIAQHAEYAVAALNDVPIISENYVWHQILKANKRPRHIGIDYPLALGIKGTRDASKVYRSAMRLCSETLRLIRDEIGERAKNPRFKALLAEPVDKHGL